jgi:hypothetical protein
MPSRRATAEHFRHNVVGYIALFCFAIGGTAIALPGRNTVDSGDIRRSGVRAPDLAKRAVTRVKLAPNSIDSSKVVGDSLTGADVDESTLSLPSIGAGAVGPLEEADRQRRIVIPAAALIARGEAGNAALSNTSSFGIVEFRPETQDTSAFLSTQVPVDRVPGTPLTLRLFWDGNGTGAVAWEVAHQTAAVGQDNTAPVVSDLATATTPNVFTVSAFSMPGGALQNGDILGVRITRDFDNPADTLEVFARLYVVEIGYTATD